MITTADQLPRDPQDVKIELRRMFGTPGVYITTEAGTAFVPLPALPDVVRRLVRMQARLMS